MGLSRLLQTKYRKVKYNITEPRVDMHLGISGTNVCLRPRDNTEDLVPWEFTPVPGKSDEFYIRNMWEAPDESRVGMHLSFSGNIVCLYPKDNTADLVPWKFTPARLKNWEVRSIIRQDLDGRLHPNVSIKLADWSYYPPSLEHARSIIKQSSTDRFKWIAERFDCDDFAIVLKADFAMDAANHAEYTAGHAFGILWGHWVNHGGHAINWMIGDDLKVRLIEPQNDQIFFPDDPHGEDFQNIFFMNS